MPKLFVALDLPDVARSAVIHLQPSPMPGMRLPEPSQIHLTLHFLGEADVRRVSECLKSVAVPAFSLRLRGVGQFPSQDGAVTLWAGVVQDDGLTELHRAVAKALEGEGFRPEARAYAPHVTVARCGSSVPARTIGSFMAAHQDFAVPDVDVKEFGLYSTTFIDGAPVYRREHSFYLR